MNSFFDDVYNYEFPESLFNAISFERMIVQYAKIREDALNTIQKRYSSNYYNNNQILKLDSGRLVYLNPESKFDKELPKEILDEINIDINFSKLKDMGFFTDDEFYDKYHRNMLNEKEKLNLQYCIFLDVIYQLILKNQNKSLFGKANLSSIVKANSCMLKFNLFSTKKEEFKSIFDQDSFLDESLVLEVLGDKVSYKKLERHITYNKDKKIDKIFNYFYQFLMEMFEVNEETEKAYKKEKKYYIKNRKQKNDVYVNKENLILYNKLHYNYFANWLIKYYKKDKNQVCYSYSCHQQGDVFCNNTRIATIRGCNILGDLSLIINLKEVYPIISERHGLNFSKREIYTALDFFYIYETLEYFFKILNYSLLKKKFYVDIWEILFFYIYSAGYLLNNMNFFSIFYLNQLKDIIKKENIVYITDEIKITSFYISSLISLLKETGNSDIDINVILKEINRYNEFIENITEKIKISDIKDLKEIFNQIKSNNIISEDREIFCEYLDLSEYNEVKDDVQSFFLGKELDGNFVIEQSLISNPYIPLSLRRTNYFVSEYLLQSKWINKEEFKGRKFKDPKKEWDEMLIFYNKMKKQNRA